METRNRTYKNLENYYFKVMSYDTKLESSIIESHRKEIDDQLGHMAVFFLDDIHYPQLAVNN